MQLKINGVLAAPADPIPPYQFGKSVGDTPFSAFWNDVVRGNQELWDWHSPFWEGNKEVVRQNFDPGAWIEIKLQTLGHLLATNSPEIITVGIVLCALLAMVAPLVGSPTYKWIGRTFTVFFLGAVWRVFL
jgi:hypothetical protein